ncbi:MAG: hypothetical protein CL675_00120 [Bdellovibrionaceae bacterium]|nr:hypothetical protein [Pseudobdellovibrionaceae bacterium]
MDWKIDQYQFITTEDGSPSLAFVAEDGYQEAMHNRHGAFSETCYIYEPSIVAPKSWNRPPKILSVGLGAGYNELLSLAHYGESSTGTIISTEANPELRQHFASYGLDQPLPESFKDCYDRITELCATQAGTSPAALKSALKRWLEDDRLQLLGPVEEIEPIEPCNVILYDAFSGRMNRHLWEEDFLAQFLTKWASTPCALSTYAATGNLKRAIKANGFELQDKPGFAGKRQSTFALKQ